MRYSRGYDGPSWPVCETVESVSSKTEPEDIEVHSVGLVGPYVTLSPVGSAGRLSQCDSDQSVTPSPVFSPIWTGRSVSPETEPEDVHVHSAGPVGPFFTLSPVGSAGRHSQCDSDQPVADGPVGPSVTPGPVGPSGINSQCDRNQPVADGPVGQCGSIPLSADCSVEHYGMSSTHDIDNEIVVTVEQASSIGTSLSGDSGIQSLDEPWEDTSVVHSEVAEEQYGGSGVSLAIQECVTLPHVPTESEEDRDNVYPLLDSVLIKRSHKPPIIQVQTDAVTTVSTEMEGECSDRDMDYDDSYSETDESGFDDSRVPPDIVDPPDMSNWGVEAARHQWDICSSLIIGSETSDLDVCNLADFSSDEEDTSNLEIYECPETNVDTVLKIAPDIDGQCDTSSSVITETDSRDYDICNLADFSSDENDNNVLDSTVCSEFNVEAVGESLPGLGSEYDASSSFIQVTDGGSYDICNLADFSSDNEDTTSEGESGDRKYTLERSHSCHTNLVTSKIRIGNTNLMLYAGRW